MNQKPHRLKNTSANRASNRAALRELKPFMSLLLIIMTLFTVVFFKMELRRMGYSVLKLSRQEKRIRDHQRSQVIELAKITRPERVQNVAQSRLTLKKAEAGQIIQMTEQGIAIRQ